PVTRGLLPVAEVPVVVVDHDDAARLGWNVVGTADPDRTDVDRGRDLGCSRLGEQQGQERNRGKDGAAHWVPPSRERVNHARDEASTVPIFNWLEFNDLRNSRGSRCPPSWTLVTRIGRAPVVTWCVAKVTSSPEQPEWGHSASPSARTTSSSRRRTSSPFVATPASRFTATTIVSASPSRGRSMTNACSWSTSRSSSGWCGATSR